MNKKKVCNLKEERKKKKEDMCCQISQSLLRITINYASTLFCILQRELLSSPFFCSSLVVTSKQKKTLLAVDLHKGDRQQV